MDTIGPTVRPAFSGGTIHIRLRFLLILLIVNSLVIQARIVCLPELNMPESILVFNKKMYITERCYIYIYSIGDYKLIKKFGKKGEGPGEFIPKIRLDTCNNKLVVISRGKISYYNEWGEYIKERRTPQAFSLSGILLSEDLFVSVDNYVAARRTISIYNSNFEKVKDIYRNYPGYRLRGILENKIIMHSYDSKVFIGVDNEFKIDVFDSTGHKLYTIARKYERIKLTERHKNEFFRGIESNPRTRNILPKLKREVLFPDYFPAIKRIIVSDNKIYIQTFTRENDKVEFYISDISGKPIKRLFLTVHQAFSGFTFDYPFTIQNGSMYQVVENDECGSWELHINKIL